MATKKRSWRWRRAAWLPCAVVSTVAVLGACGGSGGGSGDAGGGATLPYGLASRTPLAAHGFPGVPPTPRPVDVEPAYPNVSFQTPIYLTSAQVPDGSSWMFAVQQGGIIRVFRNDDTILNAQATNFLDITSLVTFSGEQGLLGLTFDPDFGTPGDAHEGEFYVHYSASTPRRSVIARFTATFPAGQAPVVTNTTPEVILEVSQPYSNHNAGSIEFGPDDYLYIAMGDGGSGGDPQNHAQNLGDHLGAFLRIDPRNPPPGQMYAIPPDNPFVGNPNALDEIWAYGFRNPFRFSFDALTGDLWAGDVGQVTREEIDLVTRGGNYGWRVYEGNVEFNNPSSLPPDAFVAPIIDYPRSLGSTVVGGYVYRGQDVPSLSGAYVYADFGSGRVWALTYDGTAVTSNTEIQSINSIAGFGEDERGELYAVTIGGTIYRFVEPAGGPPTTVPAKLSDTGLFTNLATLTPTAGLIPYDLNSALYSDDAFKRRWIGLPGTSTMTFSPGGNWSFPVGTVLVKHFELEETVGDPSSRRRIETRVLIHGTSEWLGYTYRWNAAQTDADLMDTSMDEDFVISDASAPGGSRSQTWHYPSRTECMQCHTQAAGRVLGVRTGQVNRDYNYAAATDNQLRTWNHIGLFSNDLFPVMPEDPSLYTAWPNPEDGSASLSSRARAYLAANCAQCHLPSGPAPGDLDLRYATARSAMNAIDVRPQSGDLGLSDAYIIRTDVKEDSVLWERMRRLDNTRMPRIGSLRVHQSAVDLIGTWIDAGAP